MTGSAPQKNLEKEEDDTLEWLAKTTRFLLNVISQNSRKTASSEEIATTCSKDISDNEVSVTPCKECATCGSNVGNPVIYSIPVDESSGEDSKSGRRVIVIVPCPPSGPRKGGARVKKSKPCPAAVQSRCCASCSGKSQNKTSPQSSRWTKNPSSYCSSTDSVPRNAVSGKYSQSFPSGEETSSMGPTGLSSGRKYSGWKQSEKLDDQTSASTICTAWSQHTTAGLPYTELSRHDLPGAGARKYNSTIFEKHYTAIKNVANHPGYTSSVTYMIGPKEFTAHESQSFPRNFGKTENEDELKDTLKTNSAEAVRPGEKFRTCFPLYDKCPCNTPLPPWLDPNYKEPEPRPITPVYVPPEPSPPEFNPWHNTDAKKPYKQLPHWEDGFPGGLPYDHMHMEFPTDESQDI